MFSFYLSYIVILFDADMMISSFSLLNFEFLWGPMFFFNPDAVSLQESAAGMGLLCFVVSRREGFFQTHAFS